MVEEPYTVREARIHVRHVRDLLKSADDGDALCGSECASLSYLGAICQGDVSEMSNKARFSRAKLDSPTDCTPPDHILPGSTERPLLALHPTHQQQQQAGGRIACLKVLTPSAWNPPPGHRRLHGDLLYVHVVTLEDKRFHITACTKGFFVNQSSDHAFDPSPASAAASSSGGGGAGAGVCHSLIELLSQLSPAFKKNFSTLQKKRLAKHPFERVATPYQVYSWMSPVLEHSIDALRAEDAFSSKLGKL